MRKEKDKRLLINVLTLILDCFRNDKVRRKTASACLRFLWERLGYDVFRFLLMRRR